jgi:hypothetical protein
MSRSSGTTGRRSGEYDAGFCAPARKQKLRHLTHSGRGAWTGKGQFGGCGRITISMRPRAESHAFLPASGKRQRVSEARPIRPRRFAEAFFCDPLSLLGASGRGVLPAAWISLVKGPQPISSFAKLKAKSVSPLRCSNYRSPPCGPGRRGWGAEDGPGPLARPALRPQ